MTRYALTIFLSAFLLFQVQPILGKTIVSAFGGGAGVWTACMVFFQVMLLGGYAYAHWISAKLAVKRQALVHVSMLALSMWALNISAPATAWQPADTSLPTARILMVLCGHVGIPYLMLSATGPLLQNWFAMACPGESPYRLYALSNVGSLLALLSYPFVIETLMALPTQGVVWTVGYTVFVCVCGAVAWPFVRGRVVAAGPLDGTIAGTIAGVAATPRPALATVCTWTVLAALGSMMLIATTNAQSQDVAATPFLWVVPLAVYLLTFIICFDRDRWYDRRVFVPLLVAGSVMVAFVNMSNLSIAAQIGTYTATMFAACMVCHGELARSRPAAEHLTMFYLTVALGGALGGLFVALAAPILFRDYWEYPFGLLAVLALVLWRLRSGLLWVRRLRIAGFVGVSALGLTIGYQIFQDRRGVLDGRRSFYGVLRVQRVVDQSGRISTQMSHGEITHGAQIFNDAERHWPTTYYGLESGVGIAINALRTFDVAGRPRALRIGVVGLGTGTIAALTRAGDYLRFYEINADVEELARKHFTFLNDARAEVDVIIGDARIMMERERERGEVRGFDLLVVDAFNGDSIPVHLLTKEALRIYESHLNPTTGVIAFHVSSRHLDLVRVVRGISEPSGFETRYVVAPEEPKRASTSNSQWALVSRSQAFLTNRLVLLASEVKFRLEPVVWSDDFSSVMSVLRSPLAAERRWNVAPNRGRFVLDLAGMIDRREEQDILWRTRQLYADTDRRYPLLVATISDLPDGALDSFVDQLFQNFRLGTKDSRAVLMVIERKGKSANMCTKLGDGWDATLRLDVKNRFPAAVTSAVQSGSSFSRAVAIGVQELERAIREREKVPVGWSQAARPAPTGR